MENKVENTDMPENSDKISVMKMVEMLLKNPAGISSLLKEKVNTLSAVLPMLVIYVLCTLCFGLIVGSFSGGVQWYAAPLKISLGLLFTSLLCLPSLYIFSCLSGADIKLDQTAGLLIAGITLFSILLIGFAPVAWVFSQSTNSIAFIGFLYLVFWGIGTLFAIRTIYLGLKAFNAKIAIFIIVWSGVFILTSLQMMTSVRPIVGESETFLPVKKQFFLQHWLECMDKDLNASRKNDQRGEVHVEKN
jgi:hypothetical protein